MKTRSLCSNVALCLSSGYCLARASGDIFSLPTISYGLVFINSCLGIVQDVMDNDEGLSDIRKFTKVSYSMFSYPCIVGQLWLKNYAREVVGYIHAAAAMIPFCLYLRKKDYNDLFHTIVLGETISCIYIGIIKGNYWAIGCGVLYSVTLLGKMECNDFPKEECYNYCIAVCVLLSFYALGGRIY